MIPGVEVVPRAGWLGKVRAFSGPAMVLAMVDTFVLHYTAAKNLPDGDPGELGKVRAYLARIAASYWSIRMYALGYNFAVDHLGVVYELRGWDIRCAANKGWNERTVAVLCLVDGDDEMPPPMLRSVNAIYAEADRRTQRRCQLKGHRDIGATHCPGDGIYHGQIRSGAVRPEPITAPPVTPPPPPTDEDDDDMKHLYRWVHIDQPGQFLIGAGAPTRVTPELAKRYDRLHIPVVRERDDAMLKACLHATGLTVEDLGA